IRSGVQAVDKGQTEASMSLGLTHFQTMYKIVLPQAIKNILPAIGNEYVTVIKETSLASSLYVGELMTVQKNIGAATYLYLDAYIVVAIFYFVSTFSLSKVIKLIEKRMKVSD
ncbi:MAG: ABC transporter permease subunit, partial [Bacilli bacterium]